jgi:hypothetical protein
MTMAGSSVTVKYRTPRGTLNEAEVGMARSLGLREPTPTAGGGIVDLVLSLIPDTATIDETGVRSGGVMRPWADFGLAYETDHLICLIVTSTSGPFTLPKTSLDEANLAIVRDLISRHVVSTPETLDSIARIRTGGA